MTLPILTERASAYFCYNMKFYEETHGIAMEYYLIWNTVNYYVENNKHNIVVVKPDAGTHTQ
jgi:hypothetical protein